MLYCPKCGFEYREDITECPDCHCNLTNNPQKAHEAKYRNGKIELVPIYKGDSSTALILQGFLEEKKITAVVRPPDFESQLQSMVTIFPEGVVLVSDLDLNNHRSEIEECLELIKNGENAENGKDDFS